MTALVIDPPAPAAAADTVAARERATLEALRGPWLEHARANRARAGVGVGALWLGANTKTGVLVAAGPSLEASLPELRALDRDAHEIVCVDMALKYLLAAGVVPDYVICADASEEIGRTLAGVTLSLPLLLATVVHPATGQAWPGPTYWFNLMSNVYERDRGEFMQDAHERASGVTSFLVPGGNVASLGLSFLLGVRAAPKVLLFGHDFCWTDEARFYCGGAESALAAERLRAEKAAGTVVAMSDASGRPVWTNASLLYFAGWFADQMRRYPGAIENRTPITILSQGGTA